MHDAPHTGVSIDPPLRHESGNDAEETVPVVVLALDERIEAVHADGGSACMSWSRFIPPPALSVGAVGPRLTAGDRDRKGAYAR